MARQDQLHWLLSYWYCEGLTRRQGKPPQNLTGIHGELPAVRPDGALGTVINPSALKLLHSHRL